LALSYYYGARDEVIPLPQGPSLTRYDPRVLAWKSPEQAMEAVRGVSRVSDDVGGNLRRRRGVRNGRKAAPRANVLLPIHAVRVVRVSAPRGTSRVQRGEFYGAVVRLMRSRQ